MLARGKIIRFTAPAGRSRSPDAQEEEEKLPLDANRANRGEQLYYNINKKSKSSYGAPCSLIGLPLEATMQIANRSLQ